MITAANIHWTLYFVCEYSHLISSLNIQLTKKLVECLAKKLNGNIHSDTKYSIQWMLAAVIIDFFAKHSTGSFSALTLLVGSFDP